MSTGIRHKTEKHAWGRRVLAELKEELDRLEAAGSLYIPVEPGGWWHQYVCPRHHAELLFDPAERDAQSFRCPHGCLIEGEAYRGAWLVFKHQSLARAALQAAAVYAASREAAYAQLAKRIIAGYARQFPDYPVHPDAQPWMLKGRAFHQALTEAIWSTTLLRACLLLSDEGVAWTESEREAIDGYLRLLEASMAEYRRILIHERGNAENNYTAWLNAALSCVHAVKNDRGGLLALIAGEGGWKHHLSIGVKPDQLEFEGSTYYHVFVLRAYLISAEMAERFGIDLYDAEGTAGQSMSGMFDVLAALADDRGVLPALHDGPMERLPYAREIAEIMEIGLSRYRQPGIELILREAYRQMGGQDGARCQLEALLYGEGEEPVVRRFVGRAAGGTNGVDGAFGQEAGLLRGSRLLRDSGFVLGRRTSNALSFLADFGPHGGSHGHYDKLHLTMMHRETAFTPEFGMVPYGSALRKQWFAETASHNTVSLGGASQAAHTGSCLRFEETAAHTYVWLRSEGAYPGCRMDRHLLLTDPWLLDWFEVAAGEEASIEWWMHPVVPAEEETAHIGVETCPEQAPDHGGFYSLAPEGEWQRLPVVKRYGAVGSARELRLTYKVPGGGRIYHTALLQPGDEAYAVRTPGTSVDPSRPLTALLHRRHGRSARFVHVYSAGERTILKETPSGAVQVESAEGIRTCALTEQGLTVIGGERHA
ncbi:heparinase [Paenibacillus sp. A3]|uniref:heparinase II/III domain-containing protein n=1 Tax=Paenibacillus sp. A3 TaxID=1337054 RepID=UPI0006D57B59|nr:heparinase II/III family protein [Paenibacillus sp. A3]KPV60932.1 heparinase [Paenibacillus sp. A3]